jgi:hypothetical protein
MGGSGKTQDFFLWMLTLVDIIMDGFHLLSFTINEVHPTPIYSLFMMTFS